PAGDGEQPGVRIVGDAVDRPQAERGGEGFAERILGARHVARARGEEGEEASVAFARHTLRGAAGRFGMAHFRLPGATNTGRISIAPCLLEGQRLAQAMAPSRSSASTKK